MGYKSVEIKIDKPEDRAKSVMIIGNFNILMTINLIDYNALCGKNFLI